MAAKYFPRPACLPPVEKSTQQKNHNDDDEEEADSAAANPDGTAKNRRE